jgi:hypothetical protein
VVNRRSVGYAGHDTPNTRARVSRPAIALKWQILLSVLPGARTLTSSGFARSMCRCGGYAAPDTRSTHCGIALAVNPYTAGGAALFYGATLIIAAWRAQPGCEATVLSNSILGRDDQLGCPVFSPIDEAEARLNARGSGAGRRPRAAVSPTKNT